MACCWVIQHGLSSGFQSVYYFTVFFLCDPRLYNCPSVSKPARNYSWLLILTENSYPLHTKKSFQNPESFLWLQQLPRLQQSQTKKLNRCGLLQKSFRAKTTTKKWQISIVSEWFKIYKVTLLSDILSSSLVVYLFMYFLGWLGLKWSSGLSNNSVICSSKPAQSESVSLSLCKELYPLPLYECQRMFGGARPFGADWLPCCHQSDSGQLWLHI